MNWEPCEREQEVLEAAQSGRLDTRWGDELRAHIARCASCADTALIARYMQEEGAALQAGAHLPTAAFVWWKSQLRARREATQRALRPVQLAQQIAFVCAVLVVAGMLVWLLPGLGSWFAAFGNLGSAAGDGATQTPPLLPSPLIVAMGAVLVCLVAFVLYATAGDRKRKT